MLVKRIGGIRCAIGPVLIGAVGVEFELGGGVFLDPMDVNWCTSYWIVSDKFVMACACWH